MFVSYQFVLFLMGLMIVYYLVPRKIQWIILLAANFLFYFSAGRWYPLFIVGTSLTIWLAGIGMAKFEGRYQEYLQQIKSGQIPKPSREEKKKVRSRIMHHKKMVMIAALLLNLGVLAVTKYTNFILDNIHILFHGSQNTDYASLDIIVPLGISFYTFQAIGYLLDVYWNKCELQKNFFRFTLFVSFFPQLIQGPISRYSDLSQTLYEKHKFNVNTVYFGLQRVLWGYMKKLVIADRMGIAVGMILSDPDYYTGWFVLVGMVFWAVQLYADFTGGIDITIGIAQMLGIHVTENFERPYFSKNIAEYWRRWHITMGTWFRDYVFYPLSICQPMKKLTLKTKEHFGMQGARRAAVYSSTIIVWLATGIWHGPAWHFVVWGLANGVIILISEECKPLYDKFHKKYPKLVGDRRYKVFQIFRTFLLMSCLRLFDTYASVTLAFRQFIHMFTQFRWQQLSGQELLGLGISSKDYIILIVGIVIMFLVSLFGRNGSVREKIARKPYPVQLAVFILLLFGILLFGNYGVGYDAQQFIYNQF